MSKLKANLSLAKHKDKLRSRLDFQFFLTVALDGSECLGSLYTQEVGQDRAGGIETNYGLDGPDILSQWEHDFPHKSRLALWPIQPPVYWVPDPFRGDKGPWHGIDHPSLSSAEIKERVKL
jgi:hypothetical protein